MKKTLYRSTPQLPADLCCAGVPCSPPAPAKPPSSEPARARLVASEQVNPDEAGRSSPIVVRLFQLRADGEFTTAEFFDLYGKEKDPRRRASSRARSMCSRRARRAIWKFR